jgi:hypothetical protein
VIFKLIKGRNFPHSPISGKKNLPLSIFMMVVPYTGRQDPLRQLNYYSKAVKLLYLTKNSIKGCSKSPSRTDNYLS